MTGLANFKKLRELERRIRDLPTSVSHKVAAAAAGQITSMARVTFNASENAFGDAWLPGKHGQRVTLVRTGRLEGGVRYVAIGTKLRAQLGPPYSKYQVGRRPIFPTSVLPVAYKEAIHKIAAEIIAADLRKAA